MAVRCGFTSIIETRVTMLCARDLHEGFECFPREIVTARDYRCACTVRSVDKSELELCCFQDINFTFIPFRNKIRMRWEQLLFDVDLPPCSCCCVSCKCSFILYVLFTMLAAHWSCLFLFGICNYVCIMVYGAYVEKVLAFFQYLDYIFVFNLQGISVKA